MLALLSVTPVSAQLRDNMSDTWVGTDGLGRALLTNSTVGNPQSNKTVGIFYYLWEQGGGAGTYDNTKIIAANPSNPPFGPLNWWHYWSQPWLGYYDSNDDFVIRKHIQMLTDAGVDVLIFDNTNAITYQNTVLKLCSILETMKSQGCKVPQISFIFWSSPQSTLESVYGYLYSQNLYSDLWFQWQGKPLVMADASQITDQTLLGYFNFRESWAWTAGQSWFGNGQDKWPWLDNYPQNYGWDLNSSTPEEMPVEFAQHPTDNTGRSYNNLNGVGEPAVNASWMTNTSMNGIYFGQLAQHALAALPNNPSSPNFLWVTQWNEWIAQRFQNGQNGFPLINPFAGAPATVGQTVFVDEYNEEFSRDGEPENGVNKDNYYYQLVNVIRQYKGVRPIPTITAPASICLGNATSQWNGVGPFYIDDIGRTAHRAFNPFGPGTANTSVPVSYINNTGRNEPVVMQAARDNQNLYFYARTTTNLTPSTDPMWMVLLISSGNTSKANWNGYDYMVNRTRNGNTCSLEQNVGGTWNWQHIADVPIYWTATNELHLTIPRALLTLPASNGPATFSFKWTDNLPATPDIMQFIDQGTTAPFGRFNYGFVEPSVPSPTVSNTWRVNCAGVSYTDSQGNLWWSDENFTASSGDAVTNTISGTADPALYQKERWGNPFTYTFSVPAGNYQVTLKFAETYFTSAGQRVFNASINGDQVLTSLDIFSEVGANAADDKVFNNVQPNAQGQIVIQLGPASVNNAKVDAIQIIPQPSTPTFTPVFTHTNTFTNTPTSTNTRTFTYTNTFTSTATSTPTKTPTMTFSSTATNTPNNTATFTATKTWTPTNTSTSTNSPTKTNTTTNTWTATNTSTHTPQNTPTKTPTNTFTSTDTDTATSTGTSTNTSTYTPMNTATPTSTGTFTNTASDTMTGTPTSTATKTDTKTYTPTVTSTPTSTSTSTSTSSFTSIDTGTPTRTWTTSSTPTSSNTPTVTNTATATDSTTATSTPSPSLTASSSATPTSTASRTPTSTPTVTWTWSPTGTSTSTSTSTWTMSPTTTSTETLSPTVTATEASGLSDPIPYPNPVTGPGPIQMRIVLQKPAAWLTLKIYTIAFRMVKEETFQNLSAGPNDLPLTLTDKWGRDLANGLYYILVDTPVGKTKAKLLILR